MTAKTLLAWLEAAIKNGLIGEETPIVVVPNFPHRNMIKVDSVAVGDEQVEIAVDFEEELTPATTETASRAWANYCEKPISEDKLDPC